MYWENDKQVLCDKCAVTFYSNCKIYNIIRPAKSKFALESIGSIVDQAQFYASTYWLRENKQNLRHELNDFEQKMKEYERLLDIAVSSQDFAHQNNLEMQILEFKNLVDSSVSIREYLIHSKYTQLQSVTESSDIVRDQYIE